MTKGSFEEVYKREECYWGLKPVKMIQRLLDYKASGKVLDVGVGEGRNALFLAKKGFDVTGIDVSQTGIDKFYELADKLEVKVKGVVADLNDYKIDDKYDVIISIATLHFLEKPVVDRIIDNIKSCTNKDGINGILIFTEENEEKNFPYLFKNGELKERYSDWEILGVKEFVTPEEKHGKNGKPHKHGVGIILARKQ